MKNIFVFLCLALLLQEAAPAQTTITASNGSTYSVGQWSKAVTLMFPSTGGTIQAISRDCAVTQENAYSPNTQNIRFIYSPTLNQVWIGELADNYVVAGQQIWGLSISHVGLAIQPSETTADSTSDPESILATFMAKYFTDPWPRIWGDGKIKMLDLKNVFGFNAIYGQQPPSKPGAQFLQITNALASPKGVTVDFSALQSGLGLSITLSPDFKIVDALLGGVRYPVLFDSLGWLPDLGPWVSLNGKSLASPQGDQAVLFSHRSYTRINDAGDVEEFSEANAGIVVATGEMWVGPAGCDYFIFNGQIYGVLVNVDSREIQIFKDSQPRLPLDQGTSAAFAEQILKFESDFKAKQYSFAPIIKINIFSLFQNDPRFSDDCWVYKRAIYMKNGNIVVKLNTGNAAAYPEITIGPDLSVVSARVIPSGSPELNAR